MRRRPLNAGDSVTLFPFLAVLICTMGSLIVLLVVVVQQARASADTASDAVTQAVAEYEDERSQRVRSKQTLEWKIELLEDSRDQTEAELARRRLELSHLEDHVRKLADELEELQQRARSIVAESATSDGGLDDLNARIAELEDRLTQAEAEYDKALSEYQLKEKSYAIVTYQGPHGTERRPVFVECLADRIVLQPEGVVLTGDDFLEPMTDDNALAMALRAKREYLSKATSGNEGEPYPLLVVRPNGSQAYAAARAAMRAWDSEFGYELVPNDLKLAYPDKDPAVVTVVQNAVREARQRRQELIAIAPRRFGRMASSSRKLKASRSGGFIATDTGLGDGESSGFGTGQRNAFGGIGSGNQPGGFGSGRNDFNQAGLGQPPGSNEGTNSNGGEFGRYPEGEFGSDQQAGNSFDAPGAGPGGPSERVGGAATGSADARGSADRSNDRPGRSGPAGGTAGTPGGSAADGPGGLGVSAGQGGASSSLANTRGRNWGLPSRVSGGTGITRPIAVTCFGDRIVLHTDAGARIDAQVFPIKTDVRGEVDKVVSAIWNRIDAWGIAGTGMYWKPVLNVRVSDGGEQIFEDLQTLLDNSGITVSRRK